jgi:hypothetical protein
VATGKVQAVLFVLFIFCFHPISEVLLFYKPYKFACINPLQITVVAVTVL